MQLTRKTWTALLVLFVGLMGVLVYWNGLFSRSALLNYLQAGDRYSIIPLRIYSKEGRLIGEFGHLRRHWIEPAAVPRHLVEGFKNCSGRRQRGWPLAIGPFTRALARTIRMHNPQLSRKQLILSLHLKFTDDELTGLFLNTVYMGHRNYGVRSAASYYYQQPLDRLSLAQIAMLIGLSNRPSADNPLRRPKAAVVNRNRVLKCMLSAKQIDRRKYKQAVAAAISAVPRHHSKRFSVDASYVAEMVRRRLFKKYGSAVYRDGYKVFTTISLPHQKAANRVVFHQVLDYDKKTNYSVTEGTQTKLSPTQAGRDKQLGSYEIFSGLIPGLVVSTADDHAVVYLKTRKTVRLEFKDIDLVQSKSRYRIRIPAQQKLKKILAPGVVIRVRNINAGAHKKPAWRLSKIPEVRAALVSLDPRTGAIYALSGGFNFYMRRPVVNYATESPRFSGMTIVPFIYAAILKKGVPAESITKLLNKLALPDDVLLPKLVELAGEKYVKGFLHTQALTDISLSKTTGLQYTSTTPLRLVENYALLANQGYRIKAYLIRSIRRRGREIYRHRPRLACSECTQIQGVRGMSARRIVDQHITRQVAVLLRSTVRSSLVDTGLVSAEWLKQQALYGLNELQTVIYSGCGTPDQTNSWFAGYNSRIVTVAWAGVEFVKGANQNAFSARPSAKMWLNYMKLVLEHGSRVRHSSVIAAP